MEKGYEAVGMREIADAVGKKPVQVYRLALSKADILAEIILALNQEQIEALPLLVSRVEGTNAFERTCSYLQGLYESDVAHVRVRAIGAAHGWLWSQSYEQAVVEQVWQLVGPIVGWMNADGLSDIPARCYAIWSLYYVGYRCAVMRGGTPAECLAEIRPSLALLFPPQA